MICQPFPGSAITHTSTRFRSSRR